MTAHPPSGAEKRWRSAFRIAVDRCGTVARCNDLAVSLRVSRAITEQTDVEAWTEPATEPLDPM